MADILATFAKFLLSLSADRSMQDGLDILKRLEEGEQGYMTMIYYLLMSSIESYLKKGKEYPLKIVKEK